MSDKRIYRKAARTPEQAAKVKAAREAAQREKPSLADVERESGAAAIPLGEFLVVRQLAASLRSLRERRGLTLAAAAERAGIDAAALSRLETGRAKNPTVNTVVKVAGVFGMGVSFQLHPLDEQDREAVRA